MGLRWKSFEMPKRLELDQASATPTYAKFSAEPFERGYGATIGNGLRRVLVSSIYGAAVTNIKIDGVLHEFSFIDGVAEDVPQIIMNVKKLVLKYHAQVPKKMLIDVKRKGDIFGKDIQADENIEVVNPDLKIATLAKSVDFRMELEVERGRGYVPAEQNKEDGMPIGTIPVDSLFSPVVKVNYTIEDTRVGQITDYDRLILEIWTNGAMGPEEALLHASNIYQRHLDVFVNYGELPEEEEEEVEEDTEFVEIIKKPITELELSVRSANCLEAANIKTIGDLIQKNEAEMLKYKNFGKKSLSEIQAILGGMNLQLGTNIEEKLKKKKEAGV